MKISRCIYNYFNILKIDCKYEGEIFTYDINTNTNTNYNSDAEENAGKYGMLELAKVLKDEFGKKLKALLLERFLLCIMGKAFAFLTGFFKPESGIVNKMLE